MANRHHLVPSLRAARAPARLAVGAVLVVALAALGGCGSATEAETVASVQALLDKREHAAAVIELKNALDRTPDSSRLRLLLGKALLQSGDAAAAQIELRKVQSGQVPEADLAPELARALLASGDAGAVLGQFGDVQLPEGRAAADLKTTLATAHAAKGEMAQAREAALAARKADSAFVPALLLLARLDAAAGDAGAALRQLDDALAREPAHEQAGLMKGEILLRVQKDAPAALQAFRQVLQARPQSVAARVAVVTTLGALNKPDEARAELAQLEKAAPKHPDTLLLQAQFALAVPDPKRARELADAVLALRPEHPRALLLAAAAEHQLKHWSLAEALLLRALKVAPALPTARLLLAQNHLRAGLPDRAVEVLQPMADAPDADAATLELAGQAYLQAGDAKRAEAALKRALALKPADAGVRTSLALTQMARGDADASLAQLEAIAKADAGSRADAALVAARLAGNDARGALKALDDWIRKSPGRADPHTMKGHVQARLGDTPAAAESFRKALSIEPGDFSATSGLAELDFAAGKPELARERFEALLKGDPRHFRAKLALATLEARMGAPAAVVVAQLREAVRIDPSQPQSHLRLVDQLLSGGDSAGGLSAAQEAAAALPDNLTVLDALGRAQIAAGDGQRAVSTFKRLAAALPKRPMPLVRLADAHLAAKDRAGAAAALKQALEVDPGNLLALRGQALLAALDKRQADAVAVARSIQKRLPAAATGYAVEGEVEAVAGRWTEAAAAYAAAVQRERSTDLAVRWHGSLLQAGKTAEAERVAADWTRAHPKDSTFVYYLGDRAAAAKDWARAEAQYRAVLAAQPRHAAALNNIAWLLATQRKPGAVAMAEQADKLLPERAPILDTLSLALESEDQLPRALQVQKRATELEPKNATMRLRLARLLIKKGDKADARAELETLARLGTAFADHAEVQSLLKSL